MIGTALVLGICASLGLQWWSHPTVFGGWGNGFSQTQTVDKMHVLHVAMTFLSVSGPERVVTIHDAEALVVTNTAKARISFSVCTPKNDEDIIGAADESLSIYCSEVRPIGSGAVPMTHGPDAKEYILMTLVPTRVGVVRVRYMDLTYSLGSDRLWQRGTESTGMTAIIRVKPD